MEGMTGRSEAMILPESTPVEVFMADPSRPVSSSLRPPAISSCVGVEVGDSKGPRGLVCLLVVGHEASASAGIVFFRRRYMNR